MSYWNMENTPKFLRKPTKYYKNIKKMTKPLTKVKLKTEKNNINILE